MIVKDAYKEIEAVVGSDNVSEDPAILDGYAFQTFVNPDPPWAPRPDVVALPGSTNEVQAIVRICNKYKIRFKAHSTGWGVYSSPMMENMILLDLRRMNRILEIDEKNMYAVIEPYVTGAQLQAEVMKRGLNLQIIGAGSGTSPLASITSVAGMGWTSIYTSYNGRNALGVEWVLPTGDILRLGSLGTGVGWFCGDGPGPSLRGIMRGWMGAYGALGVFTKCAIKLYNWPGPREPQRELKLDGLLMDLNGELPKNIKFYMCTFPNLEKYGEAMYKIGKAEIGYMHCKNAMGTMFASFMQRAFGKNEPVPPAIRKTLKQFQHQFQFGIAANSKRELKYQDKVLRKIMKETKGIAIPLGEVAMDSLMGNLIGSEMKTKILPDIEDLPPAGNGMWWGMIRVTFPPIVFKPGGGFTMTFGCDETIDIGLRQAKIGAEIKEKYIEKGIFIDDLADNIWGGLYETGLLLHHEELALYDTRDPEQLEGVIDFYEECVKESVEKPLGLGFGLFEVPGSADRFGPKASNYHLWQKKIKNMLDPNDVGDSSLYT
ncbi:MAG: FAD-binding oxidoreductase [Candidatus Helarchaeota archaeon]|nr:FAD-binding oxidoreductase [Candidatus Helarchaeota archaeon]